MVIITEAKKALFFVCKWTGFVTVIGCLEIFEKMTLSRGIDCDSSRFIRKNVIGVKSSHQRDSSRITENRKSSRIIFFERTSDKIEKIYQVSQ